MTLHGLAGIEEQHHFQGALDYFGLDDFTYTVRDNNGNESNPARVNVTVEEQICSVSPRTLIFSDVLVGDSAVLQFTVTN
ncbi:MAG: hypothetical protein ACFFCO_07200, partial [Promethearchaeota archaeon]